MNYVGKWFTNLTGVPDDLFLILSSKPLSAYHYMCYWLKLSRLDLSRGGGPVRTPLLDRPVDAEIQRKGAHHLMIARIFLHLPHLSK